MGSRLPLWIRVLVATALLPCMVAGYIPYRIGTGPNSNPFDAGPFRWLGLLFALVGVLLLLETIREFAVSGKGTLAPWDAPTSLVDRSLYGWVRNPMYLGVLATILGQGLWWHSMTVLGYALFVAAAAHLRVVVFEEPTLRRLFGARCEDYLKRVPRWIPRRPSSSGV